MNWIRKEKRLAIYLRDGLACVWCNASVEDGAKLTLDHLTPHSARGTNDATNLVTSCHTCNSARGARSVQAFARVVARYVNHGMTAARVLAFVAKTTARPIDVDAAKRLIAKRGGFVNACKKAR